MNQNDDDGKIPDELKALLGKGLLAALLGQAFGVGGHDAFFESLSEENKKRHKQLDDKVTARFDELKHTCFNHGCSVFGVARQNLQVSLYGGLSVYDNCTTHVGGTMEGTCLSSLTQRMNFAPESDEEIYSAKQLRPEGVAPSLLALAVSVKKEIPSMFAGAFAKPETDEVDLLDHLLDAVLVEFYQIADKKRADHGDHFHYDMELLTRVEFDQAFLLGNEAFKLPALPVDSSATLDFLSSLTFMDENPESGG